MQQHPDTHGPDTPPPNSSSGLLDYLAVILKHRRMVFGIVLAAVIITAVYASLLPNIYTAKVMILPLETDKAGVGVALGQLGEAAGIAGLGMGGSSITDLHMTMLRSETVRDPLIERFKLMEAYKARRRSEAYAALDRNVDISAGKKDGVITIAVDDKDPRRAAEMANACVEELGKMAVRLNTSSAGNNRVYLEERLAEARADLATAEDALKVFQSRNKAVSVTDQARATIDSVAQLRAQLAAQEVQLATIRRQFTESSQEAKNTRTAIANLRAQIGSLEGAGGGSSAVPSVGSMPRLGQEYARLMREFKIQETLVELLSKQYEVAKLSEVKDVSPFQVLQIAKIPDSKSKPHRTLMVLIAALTSLLCSIYLAFLREHLDRMSEQDKMQWYSLRNRLLFRKKQNLGLQNE